MIAVTYRGPKPQRILELPVPLLSKSEKTGEITFPQGVPVEVEDTLGFQLIEMFPTMFASDAMRSAPTVAPVDSNIFAPLPPEEKQARFQETLTQAIGRRFRGKAGKWNAKAYIKKRKLDAFVQLQKDAYGWVLIAKDTQPTVTAAAVGQEETHGRHSDSPSDN